MAGALRGTFHRQRSHDQADQQTTGIPQENAGRGPVIGQEPQQSTGQGGCHQHRRSLASEGGHPGQGQTGDEADAAQQTIHTIEQIERVDRPQEKEESEGPSHGAQVDAPSENLDCVHRLMRDDDDGGRQDLPQDFVADFDEAQVIEQTRDTNDRSAQQQTPQVPADRQRSSWPKEGPGQESHGDRQDD